MRSVRSLPLLVTAALYLAGGPMNAQDADRAAVLATVQKVFDAMRTRDTSLFRQVFDTSARLAGVSTRGPAPVIQLRTWQQFGGAIASAAAGAVWNERVFDPEVRIDGSLAQVWAYYTFHLGDKFSHCGVDAFTLLKVGAEWKITHLADSRRTEGCSHTELRGAS